MSSKHVVQQQLREQAMPEVQEVVKKFGKSVVYSCIMRLSEYDRQMKKIEIKEKLNKE